MTWQDELQHLDAELAAGRISAEEHRRRRELVEGAWPKQVPPAQQGQSAPPAQPAQSQGDQPTERSPFPPPFTWASTSGGAGTGGDDSTKVIHNPVAADGTAAEQADHTERISPAFVPAQPGWIGASSWPTNDTPTPWGVSELPLPEHKSRPRQGPEVFDAAGKSGNSKLIATIVVSLVAVVVAVAAALFFFLQPAGQQPAQPVSQSPATNLPAPPPVTAHPSATRDVLIAALPGPPHPFDGALTGNEMTGARSGLLPDQVRDFAIRNGMRDGWFEGTVGASKISLVAIRMPNQNAAAALARDYLDQQVGLVAQNDLSYQGVPVVTTGGAVFRTAYTAYDWAVILDVTGQAGQQQSAKDVFRSTLSQQLAKTQPTVRN